MSTASKAEKKTPTKPEKPHHSGHRARLRERFLQSGASALPDYELLELLLFLAIPRRDVKPLAKTLLEKFGSFGGVMSARKSSLLAVPGVSENTVAALKTVEASAHRMLRDRAMQRPVLSSWDALMDYLMGSMASLHEEQLRLLFLDKKNKLIADEVQNTGTVDHTPAYPREVARRAIELGATALILVHNHPSGDPSPSNADIEKTKDIVRAADAIGVIVHDHIIIAREGYTSFKELGLL